MFGAPQTSVSNGGASPYQMMERKPSVSTNNEFQQVPIQSKSFLVNQENSPLDSRVEENQFSGLNSIYNKSSRRTGDNTSKDKPLSHFQTITQQRKMNAANNPFSLTQ